MFRTVFDAGDTMMYLRVVIHFLYLMILWTSDRLPGHLSELVTWLTSEVLPRPFHPALPEAGCPKNPQNQPQQSTHYNTHPTTRPRYWMKV